jgi:hypothetical protein
MSSLTNADFEDLFQKMRELNDDDSAADAYFASKIKTADDGVAYWSWQWQKKQNQRQKTAARIPTAAEYVAKVTNTKYTNDDKVAALTEMLDLPAFPYIGLGNHQGNGFRLAPNPHLLAPTKEDFDMSQRDILPEIMLGINKNVEPLPANEEGKSTRKENNSDESTESTDSTSNNDDTGFVFYQLGALEYVSAEAWKPELAASDPNSFYWCDTGYVVVILIDSNGQGKDVYLLYNFRPMDREDGDWERYPVREWEWGWLPGDSVRRAGIKIAAKFSDLRHDYPIHLPDPETDQNVEPTWMRKNFELVHAVKEGDPPKIVRQYVAAASEQRGGRA